MTSYRAKNQLDSSKHSSYTIVKISNYDDDDDQKRKTVKGGMTMALKCKVDSVSRM